MLQVIPAHDLWREVLVREGTKQRVFMRPCTLLRHVTRVPSKIHCVCVCVCVYLSVCLSVCLSLVSFLNVAGN